MDYKSYPLYDYFNIDAVFSDETPDFLNIENASGVGFMVTVRLRTWADNAEGCYAVADGKPYFMQKTATEKGFDYYLGRFFIRRVTNYYFKIKHHERVYYYNKQGLTADLNNDFDFMAVPDFSTPDWAKGAVMYQIFPDRFYNGDDSNDVADNEYVYMGRAATKVKNWDDPVTSDDICKFYGGDLSGVIQKMDYLKDLGIDAIYFTPLFVSPSSHKYDIQDYDYIDPHLGVIIEDGGKPLSKEFLNNRFATMYIKRTTDKKNLEASNKLMIKLIELAHSKGIKIILDGVFNHCGAFNKWLDREGFYGRSGYPAGAYTAEDSIYHDYFKWFDSNWPGNDCYDSWWGHDNHPKLNYENSKELHDYIINIGVKWVSPPYNADGWRLDVAADLGSSPTYNHKFWQDFRKAVKKANPDAIILAENYGDSRAWLSGGEWDTIMNYDAFMEPVTWFLTGMEKHSEERIDRLYNNSMSFEGAMRYHSARMSWQSLSTSMNELSNHDHSRFLTRTNRKVGRLHSAGREAADTGTNKGIMKEAIALQMTFPGAPTVYYGDEAGLTGWTDPDNRRPYPWGKEDKEILSFYKKMIALHKKHECFKTGSLDYLFMQYGIIAYGRFNKYESAVVFLNNNDHEMEIEIPVWRIGGLDGDTYNRVITSDLRSHNEDLHHYKVKGGKIKVSLPKFSSAVYIKNK
ncbi:MAG: glycoside hydrolase family 13 protein [Clostridiales bacterium]|nr:glycoside hydrolase family 13 protein [Clostridiales bacterium]